MSDEATGAAPQFPKSRKERLVKIAFLAVTVLVVVAVYQMQKNPPILTSWRQDLDAARRDARAQDRRLLLLFVYSDPGETERWLAANTLLKNESGMEKGKYIRVKVPVPTGMDCPPVRTYDVKHIPTLVILDANGTVLGRREGRVGEIDFGHFLEDPGAPAR
jgi:hypothetical protein